MCSWDHQKGLDGLAHDLTTKCRTLTVRWISVWFDQIGKIGIFGLDTSLSGRVSVCKDPGVSLCQVHKMSISKPFFTRWQAKHLIAVYSQACATKAISCKRLRSTFKCENNETLSPDLFVWYIRYIPVLKRATIDPWKIPPKRTRDVPIFLWEKFGAKLYCIRHVLRRWVACWYRINPYKWLARLLSEQELNDSRTECDPHTAGCIESLIALSHHRDVAEYRGSKRHQIVKLPGNIWDAASYASVISGVVRPYLETVYKSCDDLSIVQFSPHHKAHRITVQSVELFVSLSGWKEWKRHLIFFLCWTWCGTRNIFCLDVTGPRPKRPFTPAIVPPSRVLLGMLTSGGMAVQIRQYSEMRAVPEQIRDSKRVGDI